MYMYICSLLTPGRLAALRGGPALGPARPLAGAPGGRARGHDIIIGNVR